MRYMVALGAIACLVAAAALLFAAELFAAMIAAALFLHFGATADVLHYLHRLSSEQPVQMPQPHGWAKFKDRFWKELDMVGLTRTDERE